MAVLQQQYSLAREVLLALAALPLGPILLRSSAALQRRVKALAQHAHGGVAAAAAVAHARWQQVLRGSAGKQATGSAELAGPSSRQAGLVLGEGLPSRQLVTHNGARAPTVHEPPPLLPLSRPRVSPAASAGLARQPVGTSRQVFAAAPSSAAQRPMSYDDIRRRQERQRQQAQLEALRRAEASTGHAQVQELQAQEEEQGLPGMLEGPSVKEERQREAAGIASTKRNLRNSQLFQKLRRSVASAKTAALAADGGNSASGATPKPTATSQGSPFAAAQELKGDAASVPSPLKVMHRLKSGQSATPGTALLWSCSNRLTQPGCSNQMWVGGGRGARLPPLPEFHAPMQVAASTGGPEESVVQAENGRAAGEARQDRPQRVATAPTGTIWEHREAGATVGRVEGRQFVQQQQQQGEEHEQAAVGNRHIDERTSHFGERQGSGSKRTRDAEGPGVVLAAPSKSGETLSKKERWKRAKNEVALSNAAASKEHEKDRRLATLGEMRAQTVWRTPQPCEFHLPHTTMPPCAGEESTEAEARRKARTRAPVPARPSGVGEPLSMSLMDPGKPAPCGPQVMPYVPEERSERLHQEERLRKSGWRPNRPAAMLKDVRR